MLSCRQNFRNLHKYIGTHTHILPEGNAPVTVATGEEEVERCDSNARLDVVAALEIPKAVKLEEPKSITLAYVDVPVNLNQHETLSPVVKVDRSKDVVVLR
jgi:hypothetical protein